MKDNTMAMKVAPVSTHEQIVEVSYSPHADTEV